MTPTVHDATAAAHSSPVVATNGHMRRSRPTLGAAVGERLIQRLASTGAERRRRPDDCHPAEGANDIAHAIAATFSCEQAVLV